MAAAARYLAAFAAADAWSKVDIRLPGIGNSNSYGTRPFYYNHLDDPVDSDQ